MIVEVDRKSEEILRKLWSYGYPKYSENYLTHYFDYVFPKGECTAIEQDSRLVSTMTLYQPILSLNDRRFNTYLLKDIVTAPDYRRRGYMNVLMESALEEASANSLFTFVDAFNPKLYERYGFETVYYHKHYIVQERDVMDVVPRRIEEFASAEELYVAFQKFVNHFDGYFYRDVAYYEALLDLVKMGTLKLCIYRGVNGRLQAYCFYTIEQGEVVIQEIVYQRSTELKYMIKYIMFQHTRVHVWLSQHERLERIFPLLVPKKSTYLMARANRIDLYNKLCGTEYKNVGEIFDAVKKPLFNNAYR